MSSKTTNHRRDLGALALTYRGHRVVYLHPDARLRRRHGRLYVLPRGQRMWAPAVRWACRRLPDAIDWARMDPGIVTREGRAFVAYF